MHAHARALSTKRLTAIIAAVLVGLAALVGIGTVHPQPASAATAYHGIFSDPGWAGPNKGDSGALRCVKDVRQPVGFFLG
jgi:hypothetical protein